MPDYKLGFRGPHIAAVELGRDVTVVIDSVRLEPIADDKGVVKEKWIIRFRNKDRGWVCNLTNAILLSSMWGRDIDGWIGKAVTIGPEKVRFGGETVDGIRVKGAPHLEKPLEVEVRLPRKKPQRVTLVPTGKPAPGADQ
jgi:hypothetical protein